MPSHRLWQSVSHIFMHPVLRSRYLSNLQRALHDMEYHDWLMCQEVSISLLAIEVRLGTLAGVPASGEDC